MAKKEVVLPWIPDYFTVAIYPHGMDYVAHELQSGLWFRNMIALNALRDLYARLLEVRLAMEKAEAKGLKVRHPNKPGDVSKKLVESIKKKKGIVLRNVVIEP